MVLMGFRLTKIGENSWLKYIKFERISNHRHSWKWSHLSWKVFIISLFLIYIIGIFHLLKFILRALNYDGTSARKQTFVFKKLRVITKLCSTQSLFRFLATTTSEKVNEKRGCSYEVNNKHVLLNQK